MSEQIDYANLYGVKPGETDFSGVIKRHLEAKHFSDSGEYQELIEWIAQKMESNSRKHRRRCRKGCRR